MKKFLIDLLLIVWLINSAVLISEISLSLDTNWNKTRKAEAVSILTETPEASYKPKHG